MRISRSAISMKIIRTKQNRLTGTSLSLPALKSMPGISHIQVFATKAGIIKTNDELQGVVAKGIGSDFDWSYFGKKIVEGKNFTVTDSVKSDAVLISKNIAAKLHLKVGDPLVMYFIQQPPRARKFRITGIYETGLEEFDALYVFCDLAHIQKLNDWDSSQVGGFEITISDFNRLDEIGNRVYSSIGPDLNARTIREIYPQIFDWLNLQDVNGIIIIVLMLIVAAINMISALIIIILERVSMIGTLKALGPQLQREENISVCRILSHREEDCFGETLRESAWYCCKSISTSFVSTSNRIISLTFR